MGRDNAKDMLMDFLREFTSTNKSGLGRKEDGEKDRWDLLPIAPLRSVVQVLTKGAEFYGPNNWQKVPGARDRYYAAAMRHLVAWFDGELTDEQWGTPHLAHACCCLLFLMWFDRRK